MIWTQLNLYTSVPQLPKILNTNFLSFERYIDVFYDGSLGILTVPLETTGRIKGTKGEFVTAVVDNLIVKKQFTNLYDNNTTADYNWYRMIVDPVTVGRDPCTYGIDTSSWKFPYEPAGTKVIDVQKPYYKINNLQPYFLGNNNLSQVVGIYLDDSIYSTDQFKIILDPCSGSYYEIDSSMAGSFFMDFIATSYDPSWGSTWETYKYGVESGGGSGGGTVGPGTLNYLAMFDSATSVGDSPLHMVGSTLYGDVDLSVGDVIIHNALRDSSENILIGYGSPLQINDPLAVRDVCIYGPNAWIDGSLNAKDVSITGHTDISGTIAMFVDGSMYLNGEEIGTGKYKGEGLDDDLEMVEQYGDLGPGTTVADLRGKTFEWLFSAILFPTVEPTLTPPQMTAFTLTPTTGLSTYQEVGATININTSASFSRGSINPQFSAASPFRSGLPNTYTYTGSGLPASVPSTSTTDSQSISSYVVVIGQQPYWTCSVSYDAGVQPKTNKGVDYDSPLPAGTTSALQRRFEGVYPLFATTSSISNPDTKQNLVSMLSGTNIEIILVDQPDLTNKQSFDIPVPWTGAPTNRPLQNVQTYNTVSSQWETTGIGQWLPTSPVTHTIQGNLINYTRYIWNGAPRGTTRIRLVF